MEEQRNWILLGRYLSNECSEEEKISVEAWIASHPKNRQLMELMNTVWQTKEAPVQRSNVKRLWNEVADKAGISSNVEDAAKRSARKIKWSPQLQHNLYRILRYAAILMIIGLLPYTIYNGFKIPSWIQFKSELMTVIVNKGDRQQIRLSDGSTIILDAGSMLKYPEEFNNDIREVFLNGEGFFEVFFNPEKPFIVHAGDAVIEVLGTKFNVRAWHKYKKIQVAVAEGKVSLNSEKGAVKDAVILTSGLSSILSANELPTQAQMVDIEKHLGWMHNEVIFDNTPLHEILFQLERWYDLQFVLADSSFGKEHLTVHIQSTSIRDILELIATLTDLKYVYNGNTVRFELKGSN
jgi:ferric-dicitrate binding protein FerR (iron transport regulator)